MAVAGVSRGGSALAAPLSPALARLLDVLDVGERAAAERRRLRFEAEYARRRAQYQLVKRVMDVTLALVALIALAPLLLTVACLIKLDDGGPVLYRRTLLGLHEQPFTMLKFRTMMVDAEAYLHAHPKLLAEYQHNFKLREDPRVTSIGRTLRKYSVDELPQLWNVVRGEMSLIGPRCIPSSELALFGELAPIRQSVRPGISGLWQVSGRSDTTYERRIQLDREYVLTCSLRRDLHILWRTVRVILLPTGAY